MEGAFGTDFGDVRIHRDRSAAILAADIHAEAFTTGSDVFIGANSATDDHLLAHELAHVVQARESGPAVQRMIRRKGTHFLTYADHNIPNFYARCAGEVPMKEALLKSWMLDQNIYEMVDFFLGNVKDPDFLYVEFLAKAGLGLNDVINFLTSIGAPNPSAGEQAVLAFLDNVIRQIPAQLSQTISAEAQTNPGQDATSELTWKGLTAWGAGTGVELVMHPGGLPAGSGPNSNPVWMMTVEQHHPDTNNTTLYVRGHLLNDNIGGPGLDYNMVPITGKPAKNVGANDANGEHLHAIETKAKETWDLVRLGHILTATYRVEAQYGRAARAESVTVRNAEQQFRADLNSARTVIEQQLLALNPMQQQAELAAVQLPKMPPGQDLDGDTKLKMVAAHRAFQAERETVGNLIAANNPLLQVVINHVGLPLLTASADGNPNALTLHALYNKVLGNAETWEAEDRYIPLFLVCSLEWTAPDGTVTKLAPAPVPITLSTDINRVYYRQYRKSEF
jgi:hypothetical protein